MENNIENMKQQNIELLVEKYLRGETSRQEEDILRSYFVKSNHKVSVQYQYLVKLFEWETSKHKHCKAVYMHPWYVQHKTLLTIASVAAVFICMLLISVKLYTHTDYVIIGGQTITNQAIVKRIAEQDLNNVSSSPQQDFSALMNIGGTDNYE